MRKLLAALAIVGLGTIALLSLTISTAAAATFTISPWAYACGQTTRTNPAVAHDPGEAGCPHPENGGKSYCANGDTLGEVSAAYTAGKLTLTKSGEICDDMASGATIGGLTTLESASAHCLTVATCNPGGNLRLNVVDSSGKLTFVGGSMDEGGKITFDVSALKGKTLKSIDVIADNPGTVALDQLSFVGTAAATPSPSASASATARPSASASPVVTVIAQTGGGVPWGALLASSGMLLFGLGLLTVVRRRRT